MRVTVALVALALTCSAAADAEARARGGGLFKGSRSSPSAPATQAKSGGGVGVGVGVMLPVGTRSDRSSAQPQRHVLPLPPRTAEDMDEPKMHSASADPAPAVASPATKQPWCHDGEVVGRGSGFCQVTLPADRRSAPALLALSN